MKRRSAARASALVAGIVGLAGVAGLALASCSFSSTGKGDTPTSLYVADAEPVVGVEGGVVTQSIGAAGGSFVTADGVGVDIPSGALAAATPNVASASIAGLAYVFTPEGLLFAKPVTLTLPIHASLPSGKTSADVRAMSSGKDGVFHPVAARPADATRVKLVTRHFSTYVPVLPPASAICPVCGADAGVAQAAYDDCIGCNWGFHITAYNGQGVCPAGSPALGVHCEADCGQAYQTGCDVGCGPGYHVTSDGISGQVGCEGLLSLTCSADVGDSYDTCDTGCDTGYSQSGAGVASCMGRDTATHCVSTVKPAPECSGFVADAGSDGAADASGASDARPDGP